MTKRKPLFWLCLITTLFALGVVMKGAYTRLVDAGLGCPDWPGCYGFLTVPTKDEHIDIAEMRFPDAPVETHKGWPEMIHRYLAGTLGLLILSIAALSIYQRRKHENQPVLLPLGIVGLVIWQALFGMWTVTLKLWPQVVTAHLLGGFATLSLLWLLTLRLSNSNWKPSNYETFNQIKKCLPFALVMMMLVIIQISLGGWMSSNYAAISCPDFPQCQGRWWPAMDFSAGFNIMQHIGPNYLGGTMDNAARVAIHMTHRIGALVLTLLMIPFLISLFRIKFSCVKKLASVITLIFIIQIALGISNIIWHIPLFVAVAHNAVGALLLLSFITLNYYIISARQTT